MWLERCVQNGGDGIKMMWCGENGGVGVKVMMKKVVTWLKGLWLCI